MSDLIDNPDVEESDITLLTDYTELWVVSYSDFMTILMIFFLILFAHRVWNTKVTWEIKRVFQVRTVQEEQQGIVERLSKLADIDARTQRVNIHLPSTLLFESGGTELKPSALNVLARLAPELAAFKGQIIVEGHTDSQPVGKSSGFSSNWELSIGRAFSVIHYLETLGVSPGHLTARGYGPYRPRALNDTAAHRAENRRIELILLNPTRGL